MRSGWMKVIICGAGQVGFGIAERLAAEKNDVCVIDTRPDLIRAVRDTLDVRGIVGHGSYPDVLAEAGADEADMLIAVTLHDEINIDRKSTRLNSSHVKISYAVF